MVGNYRVYYAQQNVGHVQVIRNGLYYRFICSAELQPGRFVKLFAFSQQKKIDLGLCLRENNHYTLSVSKPIKYFTGTSYSFMLEDRNTIRSFPIFENEPFPHINLLQFCCLAVDNGKIVASYEDERIRIDY